MGSSSGGNYRPPEAWTPPSSMISRPGQTTAPMRNPVPSFLPSTPGEVSTGLTQGDFNEIEAYARPPKQPAIQPVNQPAGGGNSQGRSLLAALMGGGGGGIR